MNKRNLLFSTATYLGILAITLALSTSRPKAQGEASASPQASPQPEPTVKPHFSVSTNRTYGTKDKPRVWISYSGIDHLDFRVYRVKDPLKFFKQLNDPHQMGEMEKTQVAASYKRTPSALERLHSFKGGIYYSFKRYVRSQLRQESRVTFNDKFRSGARRPLLEADFARVPLLNPDQMVKSWREMLTPLANQYDSRNIPLEPQPAGVYLIEAVNGDLRAYTVAVVTDLTVLTKTAPSGEIVVYAVNRKSGEPRSNLRVEIVKGRKLIAEGATDRDGVMRSKIVREKETQQQTPPEDVDPDEERSDVASDSYLIMASGGDQFAISDIEKYYFGWYDDASGDQSLISYIYTDRPVYRPNQKVFFKGILRRLGAAGYETLAGQKAMITVEDPKNGKLFDREVPLTARGSFSGEVDIAGSAPLGGYRIIAKVGDDVASGYFDVEEYKKPEYKVTVRAAKNFVPVGEQTKFSVEAKYFFGAPVAKGEVKYYVYRSRYYHWWWRAEDDGIGADTSEEDEGGGYGYGDDLVKEGDGRLDANGRLDVTFEVPQAAEKEPWDFSYRLEAQVTDSARRTIDGRASFVGTRGSVVATAEPERYVYFQGDNARIKIRTANYEGHPVSSKITLKFIKRTWDKIDKGGDDKYSRFEYQVRETEFGSADITTDNQGQTTYDFKLTTTGSIYLKTIVHEGGKQIVSQGGYLWAAEKTERWADFAFQDYGSIKLIPDKTSYQPGETAKVLAMLPTEGAHLLVTTELAGVLNARRLDAPGRAVVIEVPIEARYVPNVYLTVAYVKDGEMYTSDKMLAVPARNKFLKLEILPDKKEYKPRDVAAYTVIARKADGSPAAGAELSLGVVDEAIYSVRPDTSGDIRRAFYGRRYNRVQTNFSTSFSFTGYSADKPVKLAGKRHAFQLADFKNEAQYAEPTIRKDFKDTAFWQADAVTGADGKATVRVPLPDNLTTWRATARAVTADTQVGSALAKVLSRKDLILRLETPRFVTEGDTLTVSGIIHNYLNSDKATKVSIDVTGAQLLDSGTQTLTIAKQGEQRIDWRISTPQVGEVRLLAKALTDSESDAIELPLNVVPAGLRETSGGTTTLAGEAGEKTFSLDLPANANAQARTLRIEAAPSIAGTLFGALDYLTSFPYGCTEQTMSSFIPNVVVAQTLKEFKTASLRASNDLDKKVNRGLERLYRYQHSDGGWGWWKDDQTDAFMTAYVVDGLALARSAGYGIESWRLETARARIKRLLDTGKNERGQSIDTEDRAYLVYALLRSGDGEAGYLEDLFKRRQELQPYGKALLALTLKSRGDERARQVAQDLERAARTSEFDAHWESKRRPMLDFQVENDIEATAFGLKTLSQILPESPLLPKVARWLVGNRSRGYCWSNTKQTAFALFGLSDYLKVSKELTPEYSIEVFLNGEQVLSRRVTAADASNGNTFVIERKGPTLSGANSIRVVKQGRGMLYLASTLEYFTKEENTAAKGSPNLTLGREYLRLKVTEVDGKARWSSEPLTGEIRSGDLIASRLRVTGSRAQYLMIEDPIPAGCEQVERISGLELDHTISRWSDWYSAREFRDQRTALFVDYFDGDAVFQYAMRVIVPGDFRAAPARAELMYQPSVQSNTTGMKLTFLDRK